jgi:beta-mannanase
LKDSKGETFPVIFRMFHEHTGSWFWWGAKQCTPDEYNRLYQMTVSYLRDVKGVHNILYAFSPAGITTEDEFLSRYPGDNWVDIVGFDNYCSMENTEVSNDKFKKNVAKGLAVVIDYAKKTNKIPILAETGMESIGDPTFFTQVLLPAIEPFNISYVLLWRNAYTLKNHFFVPFPGNSAALDFKKFTESKKIIMSKNMPQMYVLSKSMND